MATEPGEARTSADAARARLTLAALLLGAGASLFWLVHPWFEAVSDAALYLATARSLAQGAGHAYVGAPFLVRPPGFAALLAPLVAWRGFDFLLLNAFVSLWGVLALGLFFRWCRARLGTAGAALLCVYLWLNPLWRELSNRTLSDLPGLAWLMLALLCAARAERVRTWRAELVLVLVLGLGAYLRTNLLLLVPALVAQRSLAHLRARAPDGWLRFARVRLVLLCLGPWLLLLPWKLYTAAHELEAPSDQAPLASYATGMWHQDWGDPNSPRVSVAEVLARVPVRAREVCATLGTRLADSEAGPVACVFGALFLVAALFVALRANRLEGWFALLCLGVLGIYFDYRTRLLLPVAVVLLPAFVEGWLQLFRRVRQPGAGWVLLAGLLVTFTALDFRPHRGWTALRREHEKLVTLGATLDARLPREARLAAPLGWRYAVYVERPVYTLVLAWSRGQARGLDEVLTRYGVTHVVLSSKADAKLTLTTHLLERYGAEPLGEFALVHVR